MVEPDRHVARVEERLGGAGGLVGAGGAVGQRVLGDQALVLGHPGHMGVAEERDAVGAYPGAEADGFEELFRRLVREAVDEVEVYARDAGVAQRVDRARDHVRGLDPVDRGLHLGVEFLHAEAGAGEALTSDFLDHSVG